MARPERCGEFLFEASDALGERRLGEVDRVSGGLHRRMRDHCQKVSGVSQIEHGLTITKNYEIMKNYHWTSSNRQPRILLVTGRPIQKGGQRR
jgi:hypothetical protein